MTKATKALAVAERRLQEASAAMTAQAAMVRLFRRYGCRAAEAQTRATLEALQTVFILAQHDLREGEQRQQRKQARREARLRRREGTSGYQ